VKPKGERKLPLQRDDSAGAAQASEGRIWRPFRFYGSRYNAAFLLINKKET
jgi:hypothetical protein